MVAAASRQFLWIGQPKATIVVSMIISRRRSQAADCFTGHLPFMGTPSPQASDVRSVYLDVVEVLIHVGLNESVSILTQIMSDLTRKKRMAMGQNSRSI